LKAEDTEPRFAEALDRRGSAVREHFDVLVVSGSEAWGAAELFAEHAAAVVDEPSFRGDSVPQSVDRFSDGDLLLYEADVGDELSPKGYWSLSDEGAIPQVAILDFRRQFSFERPDDEQCTMEHFTLVVELPIIPAFTNPGSPEALWGCGGSPWTPDELRAWQSISVETPDSGIMPAGASGWWTAVQQSARYEAARDARAGPSRRGARRHPPQVQDCTSASPRLSKRRAPSPSSTGTTWSSSSSSSPAASYC
jgi:hypothetical protein